MVKKVFAALFAISLSATAMGQNTVLSLSTSASSIGPGDSFDVAVEVTNNTADGIFGWSYAVAHDPAAVQLDVVSQGMLDSAFPAPGIPPAFEEVTAISNASGDGFINATILSLTESFFFAGNGTNNIGNATYTNLQGADGDTTSIGFADGVLANLPSPVVAIGVSRVGGLVDEAANMGLGGLDVMLDVVTSVPPPFQYTAGNNSVTRVIGSDPLTVPVLLSIQQINPLNGDGAVEISGFSMGATHDPAQLESLEVLPFPGTTGPLGLGVAFFGSSVISNGFVLGVVVETDPMDPFLPLVPGPDAAVATVVYGPPAGETPVGGEVYSSDIVWTDGLTSTDGMPGSAPVFNEVAVGDMNPELFPAVLVDGSATLMPVSTIDFIRGDCNDDGQINIADPITMIQTIIAPGDNSSACPAACDADGSGSTNIGDAILTIAFALGLDPADLSMSAPGAAMLADPGASCGQFAGQTPEDCMTFNGCP